MLREGRRLRRRGDDMTGSSMVDGRRATWRALSAALVLVAAVAIWRTATVFSATVDEPAHIAAGVELLTGGRYAYDLPHPPLGRIAAAIGPIAEGARFTGAPGVFDEGTAILGAGRQYVRRLAAARHGEMVFFLVLAAAVWSWGTSLMGEAGGCIATLLLVTNPNVLAHAGLATTDIACAATTVLALFAGVRWLERATWPRTVALGLTVGLAIASRLSAIGFVGLSLLAIYTLRGVAIKSWLAVGVRRTEMLGQLLATACVAAIAVMAVYGFHAAAFVDGVRTFFLHGSSGHPTFLLGKPGSRGWWYYYPVALLVKTPIPLLLLTIVGAWAAGRTLRVDRGWQAVAPLAAALPMLALAMLVRVDLGVRLVLPIYPLMAIVAAYGVLELSSAAWGRTSIVLAWALVLTAVVIPIRVHPDHLAYFNALAGAHPEHVLVDSNLDWGQDLYRLRDTLRARGVRDSVRVAYFGTSDLGAAGVPRARVLGLREPATGWIAASETFLAGEWVGRAYAWLLNYPPVARIGPSMRLWYIPDAARQSSLH